MISQMKGTSQWCEGENHHASNYHQRNALTCSSVKKRKRCDEQGRHIINAPHHDFRKDCVTEDPEPDHRVIAPTIQGISEAARIIRRGEEVVSIPTEKKYCCASFVPFQTPVRSPSKVDILKQPDWYTRSSSCFGASVLLHHPVQAYNFVSFTTPKSFVFRQRAFSGDSSNRNKTLMAIKFSESHEVLCRLCSSFWPGTTTIYAPVRTRRLKRSLVFSDTTARRSSASLSSLTSEDSQSYDDTTQESFPSIPVVPDSIVVSSKQLHIPIDGNEDDRLFVGMRCPSHPITRRVLSEAYGQKEDNKPSRLKGAIIGVDTFDRTGSVGNKTQNYNLVSCKEVRKHLRPSDVYGKRRNEGDRKGCAVHVIDGEDKREMFFVPPCHLSELPSVSLVIDAPRRAIILLRNRSENASKTSTISIDPKFEVKGEDVIRALCPAKPYEMGSVKSSTIAAVMSKWTVVEKDV